MNKTAIKNYAVWARNELKELVTQRAYEYEVTADSVPSYNTVSVHGRLLSDEEKQQLNELIKEVKNNGFDHVVEEVAYTWFNRFIALRYMEVNNYLPQRVRVFTNENNEFKPELLTEAIHIELDGLDKQKIFDYIEQNNQEDLYKYLLLTICNDMNQYLPDMFTSISDYKTLLMPNNLLKEDGVLAKLISDIDEDSWNDQVQIIGWLYQYYNSELKDVVMKKKNYTKDDIPAVTQLFTPDWIVRYMTENSLGRLYVNYKKHQGIYADGRGPEELSEDELNQQRINVEKEISTSMNWKYYLTESKQSREVLEEIRKIEDKSFTSFKFRDIKIIDPCMGSGHILVYAFDVLMDIYRDQGYSDRDAARLILENNLYGLEIDERAYHLAYFALMMKARSYNRRILSKDTKVNVFEIRESSGELKPEYDHYLGNHKDLAQYLVSEFKEAKELGSIINLSCTEDQLNDIEEHIKDLKINSIDADLIAQTEIDEIYDLLTPLIKQARLLVQKYDVVITNPPYMPPSPIQKPYVQKNYPDSKSDLFAVFIEKCHSLTKKNAYQAMITMHSWMFLSSFEKLRTKLLSTNTIINMAHLGARAFEDIGGEVVQTTSFIFENNHIKDYQSSFKRLVDYNSQDTKENEYLTNRNLYVSSSENFSKIFGSPVAYWISSAMIRIFNAKKTLGKEYKTITGSSTGENAKFLRLWYEVSSLKIGFNLPSSYNGVGYKWIPCNKGGSFRRWYGNNEYLINWDDNGSELKAFATMKNHGKHWSRFLKSLDCFYHEGVTWSKIASGEFSCRYMPNGFIMESAACAIMPSHTDMNIMLALMNTKITQAVLKMKNPTLNMQASDIMAVPILDITEEREHIENLTQQAIWLSKGDWDSFETSWDFQYHPLRCKVATIAEAFNRWKNECAMRFAQLKFNEQELNRIFIDIYGLQDELDPYVEEKDVTVRKADLVRDIKSFISYAVGCMFGRYSLDSEGLAYAGGEWDRNKYKTFIPDKDDILPICDEEYYEDDIVNRFVEFVKCIYGEDTLEENIKFITDALGGKGNPREVLRNYFLNEFFKDHCKTYQKRPIYWLFDSGKKNGFKGLVYIHRYTPDLIARMRTGYIHPLQSQYRTQIEMLNNQIDEAVSTSEKVKLQKQLKKITEQSQELGKYEEKIHHWADKMEPMDLDDGVKVNYAKFQELLAKIK